MAQAFPLPLVEFFNTFLIQSVTFDLSESLEVDQSGGGEILTADVGPRLWRMNVNFRGGEYAVIEALKAKLQLLRYAERSIFIHAIPSAFPRNDPKGTILGAANVLLDTVAANNRDITLKGLPVGYKLTAGDCLSFRTGTADNYKYNFHQVVNERSANASGIMPLLEVVPFIEPGWTADLAVTLIRPFLKAVYIPGSFDPGVSGQTKTNGVKIGFNQTYGR